MHTIWLAWFTPALLTIIAWGLGQGFARKYIANVAPAQFCFFYALAKVCVDVSFVGYYGWQVPLNGEAKSFLTYGFIAALLQGLGWIFYFRSIVLGPIAIVGTLSAAYPALTVIFARLFLGEQLASIQYIGVILVIAGCVGLSFAPTEEGSGTPSRRWIPLATAALFLWAGQGTLLKYAYHLPQASDFGMAMLDATGCVLTLGLFGVLYGKWNLRQKGLHGPLLRDLSRAALPTALLAGGDLGQIVATQLGPVSIITPLTATYPVVTLIFAALVLKEKIWFVHYVCVGLILLGMVLGLQGA